MTTIIRVIILFVGTYKISTLTITRQMTLAIAIILFAVISVIIVVIIII